MSDYIGDAPRSSPLSHALAEIDDYGRWAREWDNRSRRIVQRYRDERAVTSYSEANNGRRFNILWSNVETLKPALLARRPKPVVERRFKDNDPVGRAAAEVLERATTFTTDREDFWTALVRARDERLLSGRGTIWVRYVAEVEEGDEAETATDEVPEEGEEPAEVMRQASLKAERIEFDYVAREDFGHNIARTWDEVYCVWRRLMMTREQLVDRFGEEVGGAVPLDAKPEIGDPEAQSSRLRLEIYARAWVYEVWDKRDGMVRWISRAHPEPLDERPDPYGLSGFFPTPRPLYATLTNDTLIPVPDFVLYQDQALELDELNARLAKLNEACKVVGLYDATQDPALARMLTDGRENVLLPVANWGNFAAQGGMKGTMDFVPLDPITQAITVLTQRMQAVKQEVYEITGIADIIRGASQASETATAQEIKGRFAGLRLSDMQGEVARYARDLIAISAELISEHFQPETIFEMAQVQLPSQAEVVQQAMAMRYQAMMTGQPPPPMEPPPVTQEAVIALLRNDMMRTYRVDIETDSTVALDDAAEKQAANEFVEAFTTYLTNTLPLAQAAPEMLPLFKEMGLYASRRYRAGRQLEGAIEQSFDALLQRAQAMQQQPPPPDPAMMKAEADVQRIQARTAADVERTQVLTQADIQAKAQKLQADVAIEAMRPQPMPGPEMMQ